MMMRTYFLLLLTLLKYNRGCTQSEAGIEQYYFPGDNQDYIITPVAHFQNAKKWYSEVRYNYEDAQTLSLYMGKTFSGEETLSYSFTPIIGGIAGKFNGVSTGLNMGLGYNDFYFSSQSQYSYSTDDRTDSFYYNWSELGYQPLYWLYAGISVQHTRLFETRRTFEPGVLAGLSFRRFTVPLYCFSPTNKNRYFVLGFNYEWKNLK